MYLSNIDLKSGAFGGLDIINKPATSMPQDLATALPAAEEKLLGATYEPLWIIGKQLVNGVNYVLLAKQTRSTREISTRIVTITVNIPPAPRTLNDATIASVSSECELSEDAAVAFDTVTKSLLGVNYRPIAYIGSEATEKGINYNILCQAKLVYPNSVPYAVRMTIKDYKGAYTLGEIEHIR